MEKFDDEFGDLSGYKILSFEEVTQGFEGNKNPLQGIATQSFEEMSAFKNSPFGQYWEKNIHEWAKDIFGASKIIEKRNLTIADISKRVSYSQADAYGAFSDTSKYNFIVYAHPDGEEVIKMYEDPQNIPNSDRPFEVLVFIETDDGKFDFGKIVRVKFGPAVLDDLKDKYFRELPWNDNDPKDIAEEFIKRAWKASVSAQTVQAVEQEQSTPDFKNLMIKAIQYEYNNHKFDDFSWFMLIVKGGEYLDFSLPNWAFGIGHWLRTKKYKEEKYWNGDLPEKEYTPAFLPNSFFYDKKEDRVKSLKEYFHKPYDALKAEINEKITHDDPISKMIKKWLEQKIDECQKITDGYLEDFAKIYIPDGSFQTIIKHYHAFYVGLYNGILEFVAGLCDLVAIVILILRDEIGFRMTDKLTEKFENFVNNLFSNTFELLNKICKKFYKILLNFGKWYLTYEGKSYFLLKELGELVPDILMFLIPVLKGSKAAKIGAAVEKEVVEEAVEETLEKTIKETAEELTEQEAKHISQSAKEALETGKTKEATKQAVKEAEQKVESKVKNNVNHKRIKQHEDFVKKWKGKSIKALTTTEIANALKGFTEQGNKIARLIEEEKIFIHILDDNNFIKMCMNDYGDTLKQATNTHAFADGIDMYFRASRKPDVFLSELIHEGTHAKEMHEIIEMIKSGKTEVEIRKIMGNNWSSEKRAFFHERAWQEATLMKKDFETIEEMLENIFYSYDEY
ncbi:MULTISPECIES: hypothetical protein [Chryseobacterium]|uniref:Uncharacterized protein n=1 Tax=Chryseobacterium taihuense TaxID=1141221 RepID=A0A4U8WG70_9FLAO|nr:MULTISPECIES: hypothetical protein [Chryseobacterium]QQV02749.1 hypothetical protein I6I61_17065 [Chryseobacterium sp. FDAARGOS 1104]VFB03985.1 Uncharacterised protein [Chryseobacterium taihuense]